MFLSIHPNRACAVTWAMCYKNGQHDDAYFAQQILRLYHNPQLWNQLSQNSRDAIANYSPKQIQENLALIIDNLLNRN